MELQSVKIKKSEKEIAEERKNRVKALIGSVTTYALLLLILLFVSLRMPDQPVVPEEMGADVILGEDATGMSEQFEAETAEPITPDYVAKNFSSPEIPVEESTETPIVKINKKPDPNPVQDKPTERQPNPNDLFTKSDKSKQPRNQGDDNNPGFKGSNSGKPDGTVYKGVSGDGTGWELQGGSLTHIPKPVDESSIFGDIVIEITVNKQGKVIAVRGGVTGTTVINDALIAKYEREAWKTIATANANGPERRVGKITYKLSAR